MLIRLLGYYFGEVDLLFGETRKHNYRACTDCEVLSLSKKNFTKLFFQDFREVGAEIYNNALKRRVRALKKYKEAFEKCQAEAKEKDNARKSLKRSRSNKTSSLTGIKSFTDIKEEGTSFKPKLPIQAVTTKEASSPERKRLPALDEVGSEGTDSVPGSSKREKTSSSKDLIKHEGKSRRRKEV